MTRLDRMVVSIGPQDLGKLHGLPASLRLTAFMLTRLKKGSLDMTLPDGRTLRFVGSEPGPHGEIIVHNLTFARRVLARGDVGFAEAFMGEEFDTPSLAAVLEARRMEIDTQMERLRLEMETAALWSQLEYVIPVQLDRAATTPAPVTIPAAEEK